ncbi:hypothetical protein PtA15_16A235 [Puccinia triticina]|uniref:Uncharacterized protein n=1 Tax=Puccinia triticina TaxID=208348 RepID=A0ABY7D3Y6_9BASI|nr:uncharacterized protein PtA15_16A235 [Puccinia triticina]WAQ92329.1 hypothetical protein PtA15_16A235 [Puccinia triticina]
MSLLQRHRGLPGTAFSASGMRAALDTSATHPASREAELRVPSSTTLASTATSSPAPKPSATKTPL